MERRSALVVLTALTVLTGIPVISASPRSEFEPAAAASLELVRVIYLQKMSPIDATKLVRTRAEARSVAAIVDRNAIIVRGPADNVDRREAVLREHDAALRVADPLSRHSCAS